MLYVETRMGELKNLSYYLLQAKPLIAALNLEELVDPLLDGEYDSEQVTRILLIASQCLHQASTERPHMSQVSVDCGEAKYN